MATTATMPLETSCPLDGATLEPAGTVPELRMNGRVIRDAYVQADCPECGYIAKTRLVDL